MKKILYYIISGLILFIQCTGQNIRKELPEPIEVIVFHEHHGADPLLSFLSPAKKYWNVIYLYSDYLELYNSDFSFSALQLDKKMETRYQQGWIAEKGSVSGIDPGNISGQKQFYKKHPDLNNKNPFFDTLISKDDLSIIYLHAGYPLQIDEKIIQEIYEQKTNIYGRQVTLSYADKAYTLITGNDLSWSHLQYLNNSSARKSYPLPEWFYKRFPDLIYTESAANSFERIKKFIDKTGALTILTRNQYDVLKDKEEQLILGLIKIEKDLPDKNNLMEQVYLDMQQKLKIVQNILFIKQEEKDKTYWYKARFGKNSIWNRVGPFLNLKDCQDSITENKKNFKNYLITSPYIQER